VPPGTNGVQPILSVGYSSQGGDGFVGWGWSLSGLSVISRTGQDWYHDGATDGVRYGSADRFAADGQRLVALTGTYAADGTTYDTEMAGFSEYVSHGTMGNGPEWFSVILQDGTYMEYGATAEARIMGDNGNSVAAWKLNKTMDPSGNYIKYVYDSNDGESRLIRIDYTGNDNISLVPYNKMEFAYQTRADKNELFIRGLGGPKTSNLLTAINVFCEGTLMKTYTLNYSLRDIDKSYLREIGETGTDGSAVNTTIIKYGDAVPAPFQVEYSSVVQGSGHDFYSGDYDGDGDSEILTSAYSYTEDGFRYNTNLQVYRRMGPNNLQMSWSMGLDPDLQVVNEQNVPQTYTANVSNDMNGDGRDDILLGKVHNDGTHYRLQNFTVLESNSSNASSFSSTVHDRPQYLGAWYDIVYPTTFNYQVSGDFNGDGKGDVLAILSNGSYYHGFMYSPAAGYAGQIMGIQNGAGDLAKSSYLAALDFDGDGAHEILSVWGANSAQQNTRIYKWRTTPVQGFDIVWSSSGFPTPGHKLFPGDFNGDGKTDLLNRNGDSGPWSIAFSTGNDFYGLPFGQFNTNVNLSGTPDVLSVADFNGDGKSDICHGRNVGGSSCVLDLFYSRGTLQDFKERSYPHSSLLGWSPALITDLNGDGRSEVINTTNVFSPIEMYYFDRSGHERSAHRLVNGMGAEERFAYGYMTEPAVHTRGTTFAYPVGDTQLPIELVKESSSTNGIGALNERAHAYGLAQLNRTGRGFVGFKQILASDPIGNRISVQLSALQPDYAELYPESSQSYRFDIPSSLISNTASSYQFLPLGTLALRRHLIRQVSTIAFDAVAGSTTTSINSAWNACGKVTASATDINGVENVSTVTTYIAAGPSAQPVRPQQVTVTRTRTGQSAVVKSMWYQYIPGVGLLESVGEFSGTPGMHSTQFDYTTAGNLRTKTDGFPLLNAAQRPVERYRYDSKFRFITKRTSVWNDAGNSTDVNTFIAHDPRWGKPIDTYGSDGLTTLLEYDAFGRLVRSSVPHIAGTPRYTIDITREWAIDGNLEYMRTLTTDPGGPDQEVYVDIQGRPVRTLQETFGHETIASTMGYDQRGNVAWETTPHKDAEAFLTIDHEYDEYNRPRQVVNPFTGTVEYSYSYSSGDVTVTTTNTSSGQSGSVTSDAAGRKVRAADNGGNLKYTYDSWGNVRYTHQSGLLVLKNRYDDYGRQTELWVPNAGTTKYSYNPFGQLTWQKNANGHETTLEYDNLGRVIKRTAPEGATTYTYFNSAGRINDNPATVIGPTVDRTYHYSDPYNRLTSVISQINGQMYTMAYEYDDYDHITKQIFPSTEEVRREYDEGDGSLYRVSYGGNTLFEATAKNGLEQYTEYALADGNSILKEYEHGFLKRTLGGSIQDLRMNYDYSTGNMRYRWDKYQWLEELFEYDDLNRLTSSTVVAVDDLGNPTGFGFAPTEYDYDGSMGSTRGNLTSRSDIGQLGYAGHAVVAAKNINYPTPYDQPPFVISQQTQQITYTPFLKAEKIMETVGGDAYELNYEYGPEYNRTRSVLKKNGNEEVTRVYLGEYENQSVPGHVDLVHYIMGGDGLCAMLVKTDGVMKVYTTYTDHLGSIVAVTDASDGTLVAAQNFDPWGRHRKPTGWEPDFTPTLPRWLYRGYTGHEHADPFTLINMNGRMYDPNTGRMLSSDNYVNGSSATQAYNRYSYAGNNPLTYSDPSGDIIWAPIIIGAVIGAYSGGVMSNGGEFEPNHWNYGTGRTWKYMLGGAVIGGLSGAAGYAAASSGMPMSGTASMVVSSYTNTFGMHLLSGGRSGVSIGLGAASYSLSEGAFNYLGAKGNSTLENIGFGVGLFSNLSDAYALLHGAYGANSGEVELVTKNDPVGHSALVKPGTKTNLISHGPDPRGRMPGTNDWYNHLDDTGFDRATVSRIRVTNVDVHAMNSYAMGMGRHPMWRMFGPNCVGSASNALLKAGVLNMPFLRHPMLLELQMAIRQNPYLTSYIFEP
jgi:RHS repeat-associated protein